jgi:23S rRNA pseudouridine2605 synthase
LARALSKLGFCSRNEAARRIKSGEVRVNGAVVRDPLHWVEPGRDRIEVGGRPIREARRIYVMLNKPRGLVTTASDEKGRDTVFHCLNGVGLPFLAPVGRLDQASEGLLLFTNDPAWASGITDPERHLDKIYHVQIDSVADDGLIRRMTAGVMADGVRLQAKRVAVVRRGEKNSWIEIVLDEGRNRHIRRLLEALGIEVLRLIRVAIGLLRLGDLAKGRWRYLTEAEVGALRGEGDCDQRARRGPVPS